MLCFILNTNRRFSYKNQMINVYMEEPWHWEDGISVPAKTVKNLHTCLSMQRIQHLDHIEDLVLDWDEFIEELESGLTVPEAPLVIPELGDSEYLLWCFKFLNSMLPHRQTFLELFKSFEVWQPYGKEVHSEIIISPLIKEENLNFKTLLGIDEGSVPSWAYRLKSSERGSMISKTFRFTNPQDMNLEEEEEKFGELFSLDQFGEYTAYPSVCERQDSTYSYLTYEFELYLNP